MHCRFYLDTMSIQMLHKQSTDTQLCPHQEQGWGGCHSFPQSPRTPRAQSEQTPEHTGGVFNTFSITSYICFLMRQHLVTGK